MSRADELIEQDRIVNHDVNDLFGSCVPMNKDDHRALHSNDFLSFFEQNPDGSTDKYEWYTSRVDELVNLHIFKVKGT